MAVDVNDNKPANFDELEPKEQMDILVDLLMAQLNGIPRRMAIDALGRVLSRVANEPQ
jgi:hypothetical protein